MIKSLFPPSSVSFTRQPWPKAMFERRVASSPPLLFTGTIPSLPEGTGTGTEQRPPGLPPPNIYM